MRKVRHRTLAYAALVAIAAAQSGGAAWAEETPYFVGDKLSDTSYSGWAGTVSYAEAPVMPQGGMGALYGIDWYEDGDQPCHLGTSWRTLTQGTEVYTNGDFNHCAGGPGNRKHVEFTDNARYFVRGIAVCSSKDGQTSSG